MNTENLDIYLSYRRLKARDLARLLNDLSTLSDMINKHYAQVAYKGIKPALEILTINTGNSISFSLTEGWKPNIVFEVPKKLEIPLILACALFYGAKQCQDIYDKHLDITFKEIEIELKKRELDSVIYDNKDDCGGNAPHIKGKVLNTLNFIYNNVDIEMVEINGVPIKSKK
ncbi:hypothetical protein AGMMS4957_02970 [Bacteroidia bacterium]|nr:hypothetical protein AGMMS4957_02970 [Bacteroidia bacterium]